MKYTAHISKERDGSVTLVFTFCGFQDDVDAEFFMNDLVEIIEDEAESIH